MSIEFEGDTPQIFIDETYQLVDALRDQTFYFLCSVILLRSALGTSRQDILDLTDGEVWHTTDNLKTARGRDQMERLCAWTAKNARVRIFTKIPLLVGDRLGEASRAYLLRNLLTEMECEFDEKNPRYVYEHRLSGHQSAADARTVSEFKKLGRIRADIDVRSKYKSEEPLLWLADVVSSAYRRHYLGIESTYWDVISKCAELRNH